MHDSLLRVIYSIITFTFRNNQNLSAETERKLVLFQVNILSFKNNLFNINYLDEQPDN